MTLVVPKIDRLAGIECYCTSFTGTGGSIKHGSEDFSVSELVDESLAASRQHLTIATAIPSTFLKNMTSTQTTLSLRSSANAESNSELWG